MKNNVISLSDAKIELNAENKFVELLEAEYLREGSVKPLSQQLVDKSSSLRQRIQLAREAATLMEC